MTHPPRVWRFVTWFRWNIHSLAEALVHWSPFVELLDVIFERPSIFLLPSIGSKSSLLTLVHVLLKAVVLCRDSSMCFLRLLSVGCSLSVLVHVLLKVVLCRYSSMCFLRLLMMVANSLSLLEFFVDTRRHSSICFLSSLWTLVHVLLKANNDGCKFFISSRVLCGHSSMCFLRLFFVDTRPCASLGCSLSTPIHVLLQVVLYRQQSMYFFRLFSVDTRPCASSRCSLSTPIHVFLEVVLCRHLFMCFFRLFSVDTLHVFLEVVLCRHPSMCFKLLMTAANSLSLLDFSVDARPLLDFSVDTHPCVS
ncbi:unnamed protein product [Sphenostylis stenocarpa]|uniref:Uncharacterized protein n=1 Tax=Sphenostylis stenocarpa TaxID=92480 RepID=A0AA86SIG4_9FABA|nr:unnamed protein product [Sphenostylis stenocarpa]